MPANLAAAVARGVTAALGATGQAGEFVRRTPSTYDATAGTATPSESRLPVTVGSEVVKRPAVVGQTMVNVGDRWLLLTPGELAGVVPKGGDLIVLGGIEHVIGPVDTVVLQGAPVLHRCLVRGQP
jgi:hypothetical protein